MDVLKYWNSVLEQDACAMRGFFHPDAVIEWHNTGERFTVEEFINVNCGYPGEWSGTVEREERCGDCIVTAAHVYSRDGSVSVHAVSFIKIRDGKIIALDEYWGDDGPPPQWRQDMHTGSSM